MINIKKTLIKKALKLLSFCFSLVIDKITVHLTLDKILESNTGYEARAHERNFVWACFWIG